VAAWPSGCCLWVHMQSESFFLLLLVLLPWQPGCYCRQRSVAAWQSGQVAA
jgi:hypothetical protein